jgi:hypothetical protein
MERGQVRHRCNEQIELDQLDKGGAYYEDIIAAYCEGIVGGRSKRVMRDGQPGVVRDLRVDVESVVLRLAPVGAVDSFDLSASWHGETQSLSFTR